MRAFVVLVIAIAGQGLADCVTDGTTLIGAALIHRHGDRTPTSASSAAYSTNPEGLIEASQKYGYGQLTDAGKRTAYRLGQTLRTRYDELLSPQYNKSEIYIRATDSTRTKMTVLTAMAAVYPSDPGSWSHEINWVPTPYNTVPAKYDYDAFFLNCPVYVNGSYSLGYQATSELDPYFNVLNIASAASGYNITQIPYMVYTIYDIYISQKHLGVALSDEIEAIMPQLEEAAGVAADIFLGNDDLIAYQAGVVLNEFFTQADALIAGTDTPRLRVYSAHDANVYSYEAVAQVTTRQGYPQYASYFSLELRQIDATRKNVVLAVYQPNPSSDPVYLPISGCDGLLCDYDTYKKLVSAYVLDENTWRTNCGFYKDLVVDADSLG